MTDVKIIQGGTLKVGDNAPSLRIQLRDESGAPVNISGETGTIRVKRSDGDDLVVDASVTIFDEDRGIVEYDWQTEDTSNGGVYDAEVEMTDGTAIISYPNDHYFAVHIMEKL